MEEYPHNGRKKLVGATLIDLEAEVGGRRWEMVQGDEFYRGGQKISNTVFLSGFARC